MTIRVLAAFALISLGPALQSAPLQDEFARIAGTIPATVGVFAQVAETGESAGNRDRERCPMQSVYKLPIAMAILDRVDRKVITLNEKVRLTKRDLMPVGVHSPIRDRYPRGGVQLSVEELIRAAIVDSDGTASDVLYRVAGGGPRVTAFLRSLGIRDMDIVAPESQMSQNEMVQYRNFCTPRAAVSLLEALQQGRGLSPASRDLVLQDLVDSTPGPKRIKGLLPSGTLVAHKTGTSGTHSGLTRATNDIGIITLPNGKHLLIAVFVKDSTADEATREGIIAQLARAAFDRFGIR